MGVATSVTAHLIRSQPCSPCTPPTRRCRGKGYTAVFKHYEENWQECAENWAAYGRAACWAMGIDTNNHLERWFGLLKITILKRKRLPQLAMLVTTIIEDVMLPALESRLGKLARLECSRECHFWWLHGACWCRRNYGGAQRV